MKWSNLAQYVTAESDTPDQELAEQGFAGFTVNDGTVIRLKTDYDNNWYTVTLIQLILDYDIQLRSDDKNTSGHFVIQLEGLREDPFNMITADAIGDTELPCKVYTELV